MINGKSIQKNMNPLFVAHFVFFLIAMINARLHELSFYFKICLIAVPSPRSIQSRLNKLQMKINKEVRLTTDK